MVTGPNSPILPGGIADGQEKELGFGLKTEKGDRLCLQGLLHENRRRDCRRSPLHTVAMDAAPGGSGLLCAMPVQGGLLAQLVPHPIKAKKGRRLMHRRPVCFANDYSRIPHGFSRGNPLAAAHQAGESLNQYIQSAVLARMGLGEWTASGEKEKA